MPSALDRATPPRRRQASILDQPEERDGYSWSADPGDGGRRRSVLDAALGPAMAAAGFAGGQVSDDPITEYDFAPGRSRGGDAAPDLAMRDGGRARRALLGLGDADFPVATEIPLPPAPAITPVEAARLQGGSLMGGLGVPSVREMREAAPGPPSQPSQQPTALDGRMYDFAGRQDGGPAVKPRSVLDQATAPPPTPTKSPRERLLERAPTREFNPLVGYARGALVETPIGQLLVPLNRGPVDFDRLKTDAGYAREPADLPSYQQARASAAGDAARYEESQRGFRQGKAETGLDGVQGVRSILTDLNRNDPIARQAPSRDDFLTAQAIQRQQVARVTDQSGEAMKAALKREELASNERVAGSKRDRAEVAAIGSLFQNPEYLKADDDTKSQMEAAARRAVRIFDGPDGGPAARSAARRAAAGQHAPAGGLRPRRPGRGQEGVGRPVAGEAGHHRGEAGDRPGRHARACLSLRRRRRRQAARRHRRPQPDPGPAAAGADPTGADGRGGRAGDRGSRW